MNIEKYDIIWNLVQFDIDISISAFQLFEDINLFIWNIMLLKYFKRKIMKLRDKLTLFGIKYYLWQIIYN